MSDNRLQIPVVVDAIRAAIGGRQEAVALHEPEFSGREWEYVKDCIDTGWVSSVGAYVDRFEKQLAAQTGSAHAVAVVNGTAALHLALELAGTRSNDEVIIPTLTFVATANAVSHCHAVPHLVDSNHETLGIDPARLARHLDGIAERGPDGVRNRLTGRRIAAVVPMHTFGHPVDMDPLIDVCEYWGLPIVEDATESLGSTYKGRNCGTLASIAALSFNGNKVVTTGSGGAILTSDPEIARRAKHLSTTAKKPHRWAFVHDEIGYNYRMPNLNAALGCAQMEQLPRFLEQKRALAKRYQAEFSGIPGIAIHTPPSFAESNFWLVAALLDPDCAGRRDELLAATNDAGLMTRPVWTLMHHLDIYANCPRMEDLSVAEDIERRLLNLPSSPKLARSANGNTI